MSFLLDQEKTWVQRDFGLDRRLIKALSKMGYTYPTIIQAKTIPISMQGKDILVRARTGSGKTIAFALPVLHKILIEKEYDTTGSACARSLILVPTKELTRQIEKNITDLTYYCRDTISVCALSDDNTAMQQFRLKRNPDLIISTPARIAQHLRSGTLDISSVKILVIDEADLVLSFGYAADTNFIMNKLPKMFQGFLLSATLSPELDKFKKIVLHNPVILKLEEKMAIGHLQQFYLESTENDKFLILYVFIKLGLLQGKGLIFVNDVDKCYKLKLFLQQFFISAAVLNAEVPLNSRVHTLEEFNRGVFDYLIATDATVDRGEENEVEGGDNDADCDISTDDPAGNDNSVEGDILEEDDDEDEQGDSEDEEAEEAVENDEDGDGDRDSDDYEYDYVADTTLGNSDADADEDMVLESSSKPSNPISKVAKKKGVSKSDYGVSRGIDFQGVNFVINFDLPVTPAAYMHRIGRTARGGATGTALSFITLPPTSAIAGMPEPGRKGRESSVAKRDAKVLSQVREQQPQLSQGQVDPNDSMLGAISASAAVHVDSAGKGSSIDESRMQPAPLVFNMKELDNFRYRVEDTLRSVTAVSVKELRAAEIKREILNSAKLKSFFAENPNDLKVLRHDKSIAHPIKLKNHLKHIPAYLVPGSMRTIAGTVGKSAGNKRRRKASAATAGMSQEQRIKRSKMKDPLLDPSAQVIAASSDDSGDPQQHQQNVEVEAEADITVPNFYGSKATASIAGTSVEDRVFSNNEVESIQGSLSGRKLWKLKHKKGQFDPKKQKANANKLKGSFVNNRRRS